MESINPIIAPQSRIGIFPNIPIELYHKAEGISNSGLSLMDVPKKYWHEYLRPDRQDIDRERTKALVLGSAVHTLALEPTLFDSAFAVFPKIDKRTTVGKQRYADLYQIHAGKQILDEEQYATATAMAESIRTNEAFMRVAHDGHVEDSIFWRYHEATLRARPDFYNEFIVVDIKTSTSAAKDDFQRSIMTYGYHRQAAMQLDGLRNITGREYKYFANLVVENTAPYLTQMFLMDVELIDKGREEYLQRADKYRLCLKENFWPGYSQKLESITLPEWYMNKL